MKSKTIRTLAIVLAVIFTLSAAGFGSSYILKTAVSSATGETSGSAVINVNSVNDVADVLSGKKTGATAQKLKKDASGKIYPTIIIPGISQSISYLADADGNPVINSKGQKLSGGLLIIDGSKVPSVLASTLLQPLATSLIKQDDCGLSDGAYKAVQQIFDIQQSDNNGNPVNNLKTITYDGPVSQMNDDDKSYFYRMIPMQPVTEMIGEDNLYLFAFPLIGDPMEDGAKLKDYIEMVEAQRNCDKVNIVTISLGGTILTAYLDLPGVDGSELNTVVNVVSCLQGTDIMDDFFNDKLNLDDDFLFHTYLPMVMKESNGYGTYGYLINAALKVLPKSVVLKVVESAMQGIRDSIMLKCPQFWAMVPPDDFDATVERYSYLRDDAQYATLYAKLTRYQTARKNLKANLKKINSEKGVLVQNVCGYNLDYSAYDYNFFALNASCSTTNGDGIINIDSTSLGATYAPAGTQLGSSYTPAKAGYLSPDGGVDVSTCLFPDHVWLFNGQHHEVGRDDVVIKLVGRLLTGEIQSTADEQNAFPQFNGTRNTKNLTRNLFPEAETVLANSSSYNAADVAEVQAAYDQAKAMMNTTICNSASAIAANDRLLNALRKVGVEAPVDTKKKTENEIFETLSKILDQAMYTVYGTNSFSDFAKNGFHK